MRKKRRAGALHNKLKEPRLRWNGNVSRKKNSYVGKEVQQLYVEKERTKKMGGQPKGGCANIGIKGG